MSLEKRVNAIFFDNSIAVITKDDKETFFTSFIQRDKCFEVIKALLEDESSNAATNLNNNLLKRTFIRLAKDNEQSNDSDGEGEEEEEEEEENQGNYNEEQAQLNLTGEKAVERNFDPDMNKLENNEESKEVKLDIRNPENIKKINELCHINELKIEEIKEELDPDCNEEYQELYKISIENMTLPCFYNRIFGTQPYEGTQDQIFWKYHIETVSDNSNIKVEESHNCEIPEYFRNEEKCIENYSIEELENFFREIKNVRFKIKYTRQLHQTFGPSQCDIQESITAYFISPTKVIIRSIIDQYGFTYCDYFNPTLISIIDQDYNKKNNQFNVNFRVFFRVNFMKKIMFIQGMIKNEAIKSTELSYLNVIGPLMVEYLQKFQHKFVRPLPVQKKKLTKAAKLAIELEELKTEHEGKIIEINKEHEQSIAKLKSEIDDLNSKNYEMKKKCFYLVLLLVMIIIYKLFL